ncbi:MAG: type IV-A pilus assembly ATPase PilB [Candidatus Coatesbacteria bacterium]|nr:type IV-A pilus assembly ATPase PilB [Candidatus Coatesbacteria bacterium]
MKKLIGELLLSKNLITEKQLQEALTRQTSSGGKLGYHLLEMGVITPEKLAQVLGEQHNTEYVDLTKINIAPEILKLVPAEIAQRFQVVPYERRGRMLKVAMVNPHQLDQVNDLSFITGFDIIPVVAPENSIAKAILKYYKVNVSLAEVMKDIESEEEIEFLESEEEDQSEMEEDEGALGDDALADAPVVKLVNTMISEAVMKRASDIHVEPYEKFLRVRYRIDGVLYEMMKPPLKLKNAIVSRVKIMAKLDIAVKHLPQDGRVKIKVQNKTIDLRVATIPTMFGEKLEIRILDRSQVSLDMTTLGFNDHALDTFKRVITLPYGIILVTGPTGCGKTTTLYSAITELNKVSENIMTAEDPVEFNLRGINQVQVNENVGLTFASALRAFLRQDPDIIMVGEVRDLETAAIAIRAALTGHLVFSTSHTNDAPSTVNRLVDLGVEPFLLASSLKMVVSQRLLRKVCTKCAAPVKIHAESYKEAGINPDEMENVTPLQGTGCDYCNHTGYRGRVGIFEAMSIGDVMSEMILAGATTFELEKQAKKDGMINLHDDAVLKFKAGQTTLEEVMRETMSV